MTHCRAQKGQPMYSIHKIVAEATPEACSFWPHYRDRCGYGRIHICGASSAKIAHQFAWSLANVLPWPVGLVGRHTCHNGHLGCVNPHHIVPGTHQENEADKFKDPAGRGLNRGSNNGQATINEAIALEIRRRAREGERYTSISSSLGVAYWIVTDVVYRKSWKHV